jgi:outer membrane protein OmpA-like peptidoglycan-associated protein
LKIFLLPSEGGIDMIRYKSISMLLVLFLVVLLPVIARAHTEDVQKPPDTLPPGVKREILNLKYEVKDLAGKVQDLKIEETATEVHIELAADILFDFDKAEILPKVEETLKQVAKVIQEKAKGVVSIEGHTDAKGSDRYNQKLSERRAKAVRDWLLNKEGLENVKFTTHGFGAKKPVAPNTKPDGSDDPEGRQKNRRVEIIIRK